MSRILSWKGVFGLAVVAGVLHMLFYALWVPPWQFPDEPRHFEYVRLVGEWGRTAGYNEEDPSLQAAIIRSMAQFDFWRFGFAIGGYVQHRDQTFVEIWLRGFKNVHANAPLYYVLTGFGFSFLPRSAMLTQMLLLRLFSVLLGLLSLVLMGFIGRALAGWREAAVLTTFAALLPGHAFIHAAINNDALVEPLSLLTILAGILVVRRGLRPVPLTVLILGMAGSILAKRSAVFLVAYVVLVLVAGWALHSPRQRADVRKRLAFLVGGGVFVVIGMTVAAWRLGLFNVPRTAARVLQPGAFLASLAKIPWREDLTVLFQSFWARLGWLNIFLPGWAYTLLLLLSLLALSAWLIRAASTRSRSFRLSPEQRAVLAIFLMTLLVQWGILFGREIVYLAGALRQVPQGRYLYPFLPAYGFFFMEGWAWWWRKLRLPAVGTSAVILGALALLSTWHLVNFYYGV